jgi:amino acid transporter
MSSPPRRCILRWAASWALLLAYVATGASVVGGFVHYGNVVLGEFFGVGHAAQCELRRIDVQPMLLEQHREDNADQGHRHQFDVHHKLRRDLYIAVGYRRGNRDCQNRRARSGSGVRLGVVLAMCSFVGFESATTLGEEAKGRRTALNR